MSLQEDHPYRTLLNLFLFSRRSAQIVESGAKRREVLAVVPFVNGRCHSIHNYKALRDDFHPHRVRTN